ncbi:hypothetical protein QFZ79_002158 [Arthrobacter sp. V4I6]|uniref:hypothetical protein n=1 Tax=unclassified Arthrobacter TaxID=235627 RepID=UPI002787484C|nr:MULTISPECIES: hypothetical protein [unclassified Arthrobacter]MDQ0819867.1 hypothetical protein [Arthrobacter sp. V1I7]MDQ0854047.1 hypothetical protein [Arthrobacter sp. V4I6]
MIRGFPIDGGHALQGAGDQSGGGRGGVNLGGNLLGPTVDALPAADFDSAFSIRASARWWWRSRLAAIHEAD